MSLREAFEREPAVVGKPRCSVAVVLDDLSDEDRQTLLDLLGDPLIAHTRISRSLRAIGVDIGETVIGRHRNHRCRCAR